MTQLTKNAALPIEKHILLLNQAKNILPLLFKENKNKTGHLHDLQVGPCQYNRDFTVSELSLQYERSPAFF